MPLWMCSCPASARELLDARLHVVAGDRLAAPDRVEVDVVDDLLVRLDDAVGHVDAEVALRRRARRARAGARARPCAPATRAAPARDSRSGRPGRSGSTPRVDPPACAVRPPPRPTRLTTDTSVQPAVGTRPCPRAECDGAGPSASCGSGVAARPGRRRIEREIGGSGCSRSPFVNKRRRSRLRRSRSGSSPVLQVTSSLRCHRFALRAAGPPHGTSGWTAGALAVRPSWRPGSASVGAATTSHAPHPARTSSTRLLHPVSLGAVTWPRHRRWRRTRIGGAPSAGSDHDAGPLVHLRRPS